MEVNTLQDISKLTFEQASKLLESIVLNLEDHNLSLDTAIEQYKFGCKLQQYCEEILKEAKLKITQIKSDDSGNIIENPDQLEKNNFET